MLCSWEKGYSFPSFNYLKNIANFYNVSLDYIVFGIKSEELNKKIQTYSELIKLIIKLEDSTIFSLDVLDIFADGTCEVELKSSNANVVDFCEKYRRMKYSKDVYGEIKYQQALNELVDSFNQEIKDDSDNL